MFQLLVINLASAPAGRYALGFIFLLVHLIINQHRYAGAGRYLLPAHRQYLFVACNLNPTAYT